VAHALMRAVSRLFSTRLFSGAALRRHECRRGIDECVAPRRNGTVISRQALSFNLCLSSLDGHVDGIRLLPIRRQNDVHASLPCQRLR